MWPEVLEAFSRSFFFSSDVDAVEGSTVIYDLFIFLIITKIPERVHHLFAQPLYGS